MCVRTENPIRPRAADGVFLREWIEIRVYINGISTVYAKGISSPFTMIAETCSTSTMRLKV